MSIDRLETLRDERLRHQQAADAIRDEIHALIRALPTDTDKRALERASGISRTTIYRLLFDDTPDG